MKAKELIKLLIDNPEMEVRVGSENTFQANDIKSVSESGFVDSESRLSKILLIETKCEDAK